MIIQYVDGLRIDVGPYAKLVILLVCSSACHYYVPLVNLRYQL